MESKKSEGLVSSLLGPVAGAVDSILPLQTGPTDGLSSGISSLLTPGTGTVGGLDSPTPGTLDGAMGLSGKSDLPMDLSSPLTLPEVQGVTAGAFKDAYDYYKKNAIGDSKTREQYLGMLRTDLAEYKDNEDGSKDLTRGLLKNFTDENYKSALAMGENAVSSILQSLGSTKYPSFDAFRSAREKAAADIHSQLQSNVAYPELSERLLKGLEDVSTKIGLEFNLSDAEKEKEQLFMAENRKSVEQQKKSAEIQSTLMASQQLQVNLESEKRLLAEQNEKQAREWKSKIDLESKLRTEQIARELNAGFEERAKSLQNELAASTNQTLAMMMQMQKESRESQAKLTQALLENSRQQEQAAQQAQQAQQQKPQGLLTSILSPVVSLVGNLLSPAGGLL